MTQDKNKPRYITRETFDRLDSLEKLIGQQFIFEGRWIIKNEGN